MSYTISEASIRNVLKKAFLKISKNAQVFSCEFCEIFTNTFFAEHLLRNFYEHLFCRTFRVDPSAIWIQFFRESDNSSTHGESVNPKFLTSLCNLPKTIYQLASGVKKKWFRVFSHIRTFGRMVNGTVA